MIESITLAGRQAIPYINVVKPSSGADISLSFDLGVLRRLVRNRAVVSCCCSGAGGPVLLILHVQRMEKAELAYAGKRMKSHREFRPISLLSCITEFDAGGARR